MSRELHSCVPAVATRTQRKNGLSSLTSSYRWRGGLRCPRCVPSPSSADYECRWRRAWPQKTQCNANAASASDIRSETADTLPGALRVVAPTFPVSAVPRGSSLSAVAAGAITRRITGAVLSGKKRRRPLQSKRRSVRKGAATGQSAPPKVQRARPSAEQMDLGEEWNHVVRGGRVVKTPTTQPQSKTHSSPGHGGAQAA